MCTPLSPLFTLYETDVYYMACFVCFWPIIFINFIMILLPFQNNFTLLSLLNHRLQNFTSHQT